MLGRPYTGPAKLVLAFDIGTTYSCVSYCILVPRRIPKVLTVARYPAQGVARADNKVPSLLYYDRNGAVRAAGAEVFSQEVIETAFTEGWTKAEWWKLHLCPAQLSPTDDVPPLPSGKSAVDILADFIKYLFDCCKNYIQECHSSSTWSSVEHSIEYIFTYPGGWAEQQHLYRQAVERAGLVPSTPKGKPRVYMLTEGEAGLHFCVGRFLDREMADSVAPQGFAIIDAGGGIIDLSMFSVMMRDNSFSCTEIAPAECRLQGSVFVTCRAGALIERKLEGWEHCSAEDIARLAREFDQTVKLIIESAQQPAYIRIAGRRTHSPRNCITSGQLKLSGDEVTSLFGGSVDAITGAFEQQRRSTAIPITSVFLVGGLSANDWVWSQLQSYFLARNIAVYRPDSHISKVVGKGAIMWYAATMQSDPTYRRATPWDCLSRISRRLHTLVKECNPQGWRSTTESDPTIIDRPAAHHMPRFPGCLPTPKWVDRNRSEMSVASSLTVHVDLSKDAKGTVPLSDLCALEKSGLGLG